jgi:bacterioferritin (cytochrome b1)
MLEDILASEEEHANDMANLLKKMNPLPLKKNDQAVMD